MKEPTGRSKAKVTFITRHYPPNPNINGESVWDMAKYLMDEHRIESNVICIDRSFAGGGGQRREPIGHVESVKTIYQGSNAIFRFGAFLWDGYMLVKRALRFRDTLIICTTSPPLLPFWASRMIGNKAKWALWSLDLFPEGFAATGMISKSNPLYRWVKRLSYKREPDLLIALGPMQASHIREEYSSSIPTLLLPCGVLFYQENADQRPEWHDDTKIFFGYCGNLNDAHNPELIRAVIDNLDPEKHRLVLALYGNKSGPVKDYASGKPGVILVERVPRDQLHFIDVHLVSLVKPWTHIAVPSKAVSAVCAGSTILFCGSEMSDNWHLLQRAGWFIDENDHVEAQVSKFLRHLQESEIKAKRYEARALFDELKSQILATYDEVGKISKDLSLLELPAKK